MILYNVFINTLLIICMVIAVLIGVVRIACVVGEIIRLQAFSRHDPTYIVLPFYPLTTRPFVSQAASQYRASVQVISTIARKRLVEKRLREEEEARQASSTSSASSGGLSPPTESSLTDDIGVLKGVSMSSSSSSSNVQMGTSQKPIVPTNATAYTAVSHQDDVNREAAELENSMQRLMRASAGATTAVAVCEETAREEKVGINTSEASKTAKQTQSIRTRTQKQASKVAEKYRRRQAKRLRAMERQNQYFKHWFSSVFGSADIALDLLNDSQQSAPVLGLHLPLRIANRDTPTLDGTARSDSDQASKAGAARTNASSSSSAAAAAAIAEKPSASNANTSAQSQQERGEVRLRMAPGHVELTGAQGSVLQSPVDSTVGGGSDGAAGAGVVRTRSGGVHSSSSVPSSAAAAAVLRVRSLPHDTGLRRSSSSGTFLRSAGPSSPPPPPPQPVRPILTSETKRALLELFVATEAATLAEDFSRRHPAAGVAASTMAASGTAPLENGTQPFATATSAAGSSTGGGGGIGTTGHARRSATRAERASQAASALEVRFAQQMVALWTAALLQDTRTHRTSRAPADLFAVPNVSHVGVRARGEKRLLRSFEQSFQAISMLARFRVLQALEPCYTALTVTSDLAALRVLVRHWGDGKGHGHAPVLPLAPPLASSTSSLGEPKNSFGHFGSLTDRSRWGHSLYDRYSRLTHERSLDHTLHGHNSPPPPGAPGTSFYNSRLRRGSRETWLQSASPHSPKTLTPAGSHTHRARSDEGTAVEAGGGAVDDLPETALTPPSLSDGAKEAANEFLAALAKSKQTPAATASARTPNLSDREEGHQVGEDHMAPGGVAGGVATPGEGVLDTVSTRTIPFPPPSSQTTPAATSACPIPTTPGARAIFDLTRIRDSLTPKNANAASAAADAAAKAASSTTTTTTTASMAASPYDLRVSYILAADRDSLLRAITVNATATFVHGTTNFLCFYHSRDEARAKRRRQHQLERQRQWEAEQARQSLEYQQQQDALLSRVLATRSAPQSTQSSAATSPSPPAPTAGAPVLETGNDENSLVTARLFPGAIHTRQSTPTPVRKGAAEVRATATGVQPSSSPPPLLDSDLYPTHTRTDLDARAYTVSQSPGVNTTRAVFPHTLVSPTDTQQRDLAQQHDTKQTARDLMRPKPKPLLRLPQFGGAREDTSAETEGTSPPPEEEPQKDTGDAGKRNSSTPAPQDKDGQEEEEEHTRRRSDSRKDLDDAAAHAEDSCTMATQPSSDSPLVSLAPHSSSALALDSSDCTTLVKTPTTRTTAPTAMTTTVRHMRSTAAAKPMLRPAQPTDLQQSPTRSPPRYSVSDRHLQPGLSVLTPFDGAIGTAASSLVSVPDASPSAFSPLSPADAPKTGKTGSGWGRKGGSGGLGRAAPPPPPLVACETEDAHSVYSDDGNVARYRAAVVVSAPGQTFLLQSKRLWETGAAAATSSARRRRRVTTGQRRRERRGARSSNSSSGSGDSSDDENDSDVSFSRQSRSESAAGRSASALAASPSAGGATRVLDGALVAQGPSGVEVSELAVDALRARVQDYLSDHSDDDGSSVATSTGTDQSAENSFSSGTQSDGSEDKDSMMQDDEDTGPGPRAHRARTRREQTREVRRHADWRRRVRERQRRRERRRRRRAEKKRRRRQRERRRRRLRRHAVHAPLDVDLPIAMAVLFFVPSPAPILPDPSLSAAMAQPASLQQGRKAKKRTKAGTGAVKGGDGVRVDADGNVIPPYPTMTCSTAARLERMTWLRQQQQQQQHPQAQSRRGDERTTTFSAAPTVFPSAHIAAATASPHDHVRSALMCITLLYGATGADVATALAKATKAREERLFPFLEDDFSQSDGASVFGRDDTTFPWRRGASWTGSVHIRQSSFGTLPPSPYHAPLDVSAGSGSSTKSALPSSSEPSPWQPPVTIRRHPTTAASSRPLERRHTGAPLSAPTQAGPLMQDRDATPPSLTGPAGRRHVDSKASTAPQTPASPGLDARGNPTFATTAASASSSPTASLSRASTPSSSAFDEPLSWGPVTGTAAAVMAPAQVSSWTDMEPPSPLSSAGNATPPQTALFSPDEQIMLAASTMTKASVPSADAYPGAADLRTETFVNTELGSAGNEGGRGVRGSWALRRSSSGSSHNMLGLPQPSDVALPKVVLVSDVVTRPGAASLYQAAASGTFTPDAFAAAAGGGGMLNADGIASHTTPPANLPADNTDALAPLTQPASYPDGLAVPVSLLYVRVGDDLYAVTEIVDKTFIQYRQRRVKVSGGAAAAAAAAAAEVLAAAVGDSRRASREEASNVGADDEVSVFGTGSADGDAASEDNSSLISNASLLFSSAVKARRSSQQGDGGGVSNASFASNASLVSASSGGSGSGRGEFRPGTPIDAIARKTQSGSAATNKRGRSRREAASAKGFGDLTYSFRADVTLPGMQRELVHICWCCLTAEADVVMVPCGHFAVCSSCAAGLENCCICQHKITGTIRLYSRKTE